MYSSVEIKKNIQNIFDNINKYSPYPQKVKLIGVTKGFNEEAIKEALNFKLSDIGENRVLEYQQKIKNQKLKKEYTSHLIGHLQSNKINKAIDLFDIIQTVDTVEKAEKINKKSLIKQKKQNILLQVNIGKDQKKRGFVDKGFLNKVETINKMSNIKVLGIMTILPYLEKISDTQKYFNKLKKLQNLIKNKINKDCKYTSMGMSRDYIYALKEGATHIRLGTSIYGKRN